MKVTFIRPNMSGKRAYDAMQPLAISVLAGLTAPHIEVEFYDDRIEKLPENLDTDLAVFSVETFTARRAYQLASRFREKGIKTVMGGYHPTFMPDEALKFSDTVVMGEAEGLWERVMEDAACGELKRIYMQDKIPSLKGIQFERSIFKGKKYAPIYPVQFGRGCKFACDFCSINAFYGSNVRQRPVDEVMKEIEELGKKYLFIVDDNIFVDEKKAKEFFTAMIPLKVRWSSQVSIDVANKPELLQLMAKSGCMTLIVGFESMDKRNLKQMGKGVNIRHNDYSLAVRKLREHGIMVYGTFVFGYDYDSKDSFESALQFALENKLALANFNPLMPMPGTKLYQRMQKEGKMIYDKWWLDPDFKYGQAMFKPEGMTAEELTQGCLNARIEFNKYSSMIRRAADLKANSRGLGNFGIYAAANLVSRKEIYQKQGADLGDDSGFKDNWEVLREDYTD